MNEQQILQQYDAEVDRINEEIAAQIEQLQRKRLELLEKAKEERNQKYTSLWQKSPIDWSDEE